MAASVVEVSWLEGSAGEEKAIFKRRDFCIRVGEKNSSGGCT